MHTNRPFMLLFLLLPLGLLAQNKRVFDCGKGKLSAADFYTPKRGFGWLQPAAITDFSRPQWARSRDSLTMDGVCGKTLTFKADLPKGEWILTFWTETGREDSSTQTIKINDQKYTPQHQPFFKPNEPRAGLKATFRIVHQKITVKNKGLIVEIDGGQDSVRLLGLVLEKGKTSDLTAIFYEKYQYWLNMRGWEWATDKTGLSIFDRYEMALVYLDAYLSIAPKATPPYRQALYDKARILWWTDKEVHWESHGKTALQIFENLKIDDPNNDVLAMYLGEKRQTFCPCDSLKVAENAPDWSKAQLEAHCRLKRLADWWILERQAKNGELGGKIDDDVELLRCFTPLVLRGDTTAIQGWTKLANAVWQSPQMTNGFLKRVRDVEHAAEYFSDTGPMMAILSDDTVFTKRFEPYKHYFENVWTGISNHNHRYFKAAWLSATAIDGIPPRNRDLPFNALAVKPLRFLAWKTGDTTAIRLLHEWSKSWCAAALRTDKGKPRGIVPPSVRFPDEAINGDEKEWYRANMFWHYFEWDYGTYWKIYDQLLFTAQITGDSTLLEPLFETLNLIKKHDEQLSKSSQLLESFATGSEQWAVQNLVKETGFWTVVSAWRFWSNDARFDDLLGKYGSPYAQFRLTGDAKDLAKGYQKMLEHLRVNTPLLTSEALFTDRVYLTADNEYDPADYARALLTGDEIQVSASPYVPITWSNCPDDLTVLVSETSPKSLKINLFLHNAESKKATLRLWQLEKGSYVLTIGKQQRNIEVLARGQSVGFDIEPHTLQVLTILKK